MSSHIQKSCVGLEATLSDGKKKYGDKVNALLSAWEHVTNLIPATSPDSTQSLIEWVHKHTLELVLRGEWPKLSPATKTHLSVTLQRCASHLVHHPAAPRCTALIALVHNPWAHPALDSILNGQPDSEHEEEFCCSEKGELLTMRLKILCEDRCEDIAVNLAAACVRSLRSSDRLRSLSDPQHVQFMIDVYIVLLYKLKRTQDIFAQLKLMDLNDGLELVQRLSGEKATKYGTARVWKNSIKAAELVAQYLVTAGMVRPVLETGALTLEQIFNSWALLHSKLKDVALTLPGMIRKLIEPAESAQHIYIFCAVLARHFGESIKPLIIELYIRALTTDMNELENQKAKADKEKVRETAKRLSTQFLKLADVVLDNIGIARECVLTAFSLHPTRSCFDRIKEIARNCGKMKEDEGNLSNSENDRFKGVLVKEEIPEEKVIKEEERKLEDDTPVDAEITRKNMDFQNGQVQKCFERTNQLLKTLLTAPRKTETVADRCPLQTIRTSISSDAASTTPVATDSELCFNCNEFSGVRQLVKSEILPDTENTAESTERNVERTLDALILIKGEAVTGSANYDEKSVPNQVLDAEKLGLSPQLCDDLAVVLSSPRYHMLSWVLDWKELNSLCERYLENAEEMRNTNKELKYLNIDYSQFKDWPSEDDTKDIFFGIEKGYEQWVDVPSDNSDQFGSFQPAGGYKRSAARRSLDDTTTEDSDSGSVLRMRRTARGRKVHRLESSESDYDDRSDQRSERNERKTQKPFRNRISSVSDSDSNTQDSQTDSLGSSDCHRHLESTKSSSKSVKEPGKRRPKTAKLTVESVSHFHILVNENIRHSNHNEDASGSDVSSNDIITLFSADMDENKRETIKGSAYTAAAPSLIITEKRSDPAVLKSLRMFRPQNAKKPRRISQILQKNILSKRKDNNNILLSEEDTGNVKKFAPMLSTLNLNPQIILTRSDEIDGKLSRVKKKQQPILSTGDITSELINIQKSMPLYHQKQKKPNNAKPIRRKSNILGKSVVRDSDILAKNVPGLNSLDMLVPPRVRSTVNVVQLSRNIVQSPSSGSINSDSTSPRGNRALSVLGNSQLPGTPSSGGHDSGVGMSPAGQTPPSRSSTLPDIGEEASQPADASSPTTGSTPTSVHFDLDSSPRSAPIRRVSSTQHQSINSPKKSPSPSTIVTNTTATVTTTTTTTTTDEIYQMDPVNSSVTLSNQRNVLSGTTFTGGNLEDDQTTSFPRQQTRLPSIKTTQTSQNTGLPKFQQAFGKTIYTLATDSATGGSTVATTVAVTLSSATEPLTQQHTVSAVSKTSNLSKAVQTSVPSSPQVNSATAGINVQSITNIPNLHLQTGNGRSIINIVQNSAGNGNAVVTSPGANQTLTQLVQSVQNASSGVIYTHKIRPVTISTTNPSQLNIIPAISHSNSISAGRQNVLNLKILRPGTSLRQQNISGTFQAVLAAPRLQQQPPQQQQQTQQQASQQQAVRSDSLLASTIEVPNQVSSTTLEQLREFDSVFEQVKQRSTIQPQSHQTISSTTTTTVQTQTTSQTVQASKPPPPPPPTIQHQVSVGALTQQLLIPTQSTGNNEFSSNGNAVTFQQEVFPPKVSLSYVNQNAATVAKVTNSTPVVVVTSYCQPVASPALSVTSQSSSSPCVTPAPAPVPSTGKTPPTPPASTKTVKKAAPKTVKTSATNTSKASPIPKPQQKPQEDEQTAQRIYAILDEYAEQLRNSPDLNNKPAPRRRSNPPTNPSQSSKRKKSSSGKIKPTGQQTSSELSPSTDDLGRTMGSEDSSSGVVHIQDSPAGFSGPDNEAQSNASNVTETNAEIKNLNDSNDGVTAGVELNVKRRNLIFAEPTSGQARAVIVQEALQTSSVSEALATVTGQIKSNTTFLVSGSNCLLPMGLMKGGSPFTIVSGGSKLLATTVPATVRTAAGTTGISNAIVFQSVYPSGKIISQPTQVKQVKIPTLQTLPNNQNIQNASVIVPQSSSNSSSSSSQFAEAVTTITDKNNSISDSSSNLTKSENANATILPVEPQTASSTIVINKSPAATIGLIQRNFNEITENQQICGVIASNPNLTLQGAARLFNSSSIHKLSSPTVLKPENVVCLAPVPVTTAAIATQSSEKKLSHDGQAHGDKPVTAIQAGATIALAFTTQAPDVSIMSDAQRKDTKELSTEIVASEKIISPKTVKRKVEDSVVGVAENVPRTFIAANPLVGTSLATSLQNNSKIETATNKQMGSMENSAQFLVSGGTSSTENRESSIPQASDGIDAPCKVGNGILCGNARLQEAWEPERKASPDTPWRYVPTTTNPLSIEPMKIYSREQENSENVQSVLHIINKGQGIEMASGQIYQTNAKKYFMNHNLETFQQYSNKSNVTKAQLNPRLDRELLQQRIERKTAAYERELRLQKSLSEECEDLGVDEPSTSDLFPEADLLFDTNHSPSFDHSSQDASCSQLGMKSFSSAYFRPLDSSSGSRDASPVGDLKMTERRKSVAHRARCTNNDQSSKRSGKREKIEISQLEIPTKHMRLSLDNLSQDEASNSNSEASRLSPANLPSLENDSSKEEERNRGGKVSSRNGSKEGTPSSVSSIPSNIKLDIDLDSESLVAGAVANNASSQSSGDESLTLLTGNTADVTIPSPLSPVAGPLLSTHKYTYANKRRIGKAPRSGYLSWESPVSERTRSSSDEEEDSSVSESVGSQAEDNSLTNGLDDGVQQPTKQPPTTTDRRCSYAKKKDKFQVHSRGAALNRVEYKSGTGGATKRLKLSTEAPAESTTTTAIVTSDKVSEASDDEAGGIAFTEPTDCRARRSSLRGHVKKGCACCNGSPERPKKKPTNKPDHKLKKRLSTKLGKKR
ncbi:streptococcal hemagglutinin-like [Prorops nasuta]|uniref:streptococcal hemagglutinin-like n=1 Tax=Prorops nasuta TaxID=863751 RepID=UPI0034CE05E8